jgi:hypothetical protein
MSNGVKIGLLVVIAGILGLITFKMTSAANTHIVQRPAGDTTITGKGANPQEATAGGMSASLPATTMQFVETEFDFGKIKQGDSPEHIFKFTNTGNEPLIIADAKGSCGCTVPTYPKDTPIAPGATGEILVKFNSAGKSNNQQKTVTLTANTNPLTTVLTIKAFVEVPAGSEKAAPAGH